MEDTIQPKRGNKDGKHKEVYRRCRGTSTEEHAWIFWKICFSQAGNTNYPPTHSAGKISVDQEARRVEENCFLNNRRSTFSPNIYYVQNPVHITSFNPSTPEDITAEESALTPTNRLSNLLKMRPLVNFRHGM